nr:V4R domain-containing protein [Candidatus Njordarchaeota archaeon]
MSSINDFTRAIEKSFKNTSYDYDRGILKIEDSRFVLFFSDSLVSIQKRMENLVGFEAAGMLLYEAYKEAGRTAGNLVMRTVKVQTPKTIRVILTALDYIRIQAWGRWEIGEYDQSKTVFVVRDSPIAEVYGKSDRAVCHPIRGVIGGYAEFFTGERRECVETLCKAKGDDHCEFVVARAEDMPQIAIERLEKR